MRETPQNIETEESLIASILVNDKVFDSCNLKSDDFYKPLHQNVFKLFTRLKAKQERIDLTTVGACLMEERKTINYLVRLAETSPITSNLKTASKIIKSASIKRNILNSLSAITEKVYTTDADKLIDFAQSEIMKHTVSSTDAQIYHIQDLLVDHINTIEKHNSEERKNGCELGFRSLDQRLFIDGPNYVVIAGRPSMGKTAFALSVIKNMATNNRRPAIMSLEMGKGKLIDRWLAMVTGISSMNFHKFNALKPKELQEIQDTMAMMYDAWDVLISDSPANSIESLERQARQMVAKGATDLWIDQLSQVGGGSDDDFKNYTKHSNRIARLKKELGIPIFLLAQLNRKVEDRPDKEPKLSDLKMTGSLEEDADVAILLYRPEYYEKTAEAKKEKARDVVVNIAKNRDGETYREEDVIVFDKKRTLFEEDFSRLNKYY